MGRGRLKLASKQQKGEKMERLTDWQDEETKTEVSITHYKMRDAMLRLARYEDSGLDPDDVSIAKNLAIQHLREGIKYNENAISVAKGLGMNTSSVVKTNEDLRNILIRLGGSLHNEN